MTEPGQPVAAGTPRDAAQAGATADAPSPLPARCGVDTVEIARIERLLAETPPSDLSRIFTARELADAGDGPGRAASLAARFAAREACLKLFPRETALGAVTAEDFSVERDAYGAPRIACTANGRRVLDLNRIDSIALSLTHDRGSATAMAMPVPMATRVPMLGRLLYRLLPIRRQLVLANLRRVYGRQVAEDEIVRLAQAHYGHLGRLLFEFLWYPLLSEKTRLAMVRVENIAPITDAYESGRGLLIVTGHFGNWEVSTAAGLRHFPQVNGRFHFLRRPFKPRWLDDLVTRRFRKAGFGVLPKKGSLPTILERLEAGDFVVFPFDQHAAGRDAVQVEFFGHAAGTFRSLAIMARAAGVQVVPASSWREPDGMHVLRFEDPIDPIACDDYDEEIARNTRQYNAALERLILRHPEQWFWVHRRWREP
jgi:KDO2-lipid IV(A) lauroyltransferase